MPTQSLNLKIAGLHSSPNPYSEVPQGALIRADNIVIDQNSVAEPRRGFDVLAGSTTANVNRLFFYQDVLFAHNGISLLRYANGAWVSNGALTAPPGAKVRDSQSNSNLFLTTSTGIKKLDVPTGALGSSGVAKAIDLSATLQNVSNWLAANDLVAYRVVWGIKDSNNNLILGVPSQREVITNSGGSPRSVLLNVTIPDTITANHFLQVYRSSPSTVTPSDELQLVYEKNPTAGEIIAKAIVVSDIVPDSLRGAFLYTSASQEGLAAGNERPPFAVDIATFRNSTFFAGTKTPQRSAVFLISVSGTNGLMIGDTITIGVVVYTGAAAENVAAREFKVDSASSSPALNIQSTSQSLIKIINQATASFVYAFYLSNIDELPGKILLEERGVGGTAFLTTVSRASAWTIGTALSVNDDRKNGIAYSKSFQPEHVPLTNYFEVGSRQTEIKRIVALRDSLFVFKEDGVYRVFDDGGGGFQVQLFDSSAKLLGIDTPAVLNNQIYCLTDQGVVTVTETGVSVISRPLEKEFIAAQSASISNLKNLSFGVSYESDRKYIIGIISRDDPTAVNQLFVFNVFTNTWTRWPLRRTCGVLGTLDVRDNAQKELLYFGENLVPRVSVERKNLDYSDYADFLTQTTITATSGDIVTISGFVTAFTPGDILFQNITTWAVVVSVNENTSTLKLSTDAEFTLGTATHYKAINCAIEWTPIAIQNPANIRQLHECHFIYRIAPSGNVTASFASDLSGFFENVALNGIDPGLWGLFDWSETVSWGGDGEARNLRVWVPRQKQVCSYLNVRISSARGFSNFEMLGVSLFGEESGSSRVRR
jgi:hypothetical protein